MSNTEKGFTWRSRSAFVIAAAGDALLMDGDLDGAIVEYVLARHAPGKLKPAVESPVKTEEGLLGLAKLRQMSMSDLRAARTGLLAEAKQKAADHDFHTQWLRAGLDHRDGLGVAGVRDEEDLPVLTALDLPGEHAHGLGGGGPLV